MASFPLVDSPCPHDGPLSEILDSDHCRLCDKKVHDLGPMNSGERRSLLRKSEGELCVRYAQPARVARMIGTTAVGAGALTSPAFAQTAAPDPQQVSADTQQAIQEAIPEEQWIIVGGIRDPKAAHWVKAKKARKGREMPVIDESAEASGSSAKS